MKTIWKYYLTITDRQTISTPFGAKPIYVAQQAERICIWFEVELDTGREEDHEIMIVGTGNPITAQPYKYIGSVGNQFPWHIFEVL
jgi:hypothetical protein